MPLFTPTSTQNDKVLQALASRVGQWVPMPTLAAAMGGYAVHSRIADLRKRGHAIAQKTERVLQSDGTRKAHSFYRLSNLIDS